MYRRRRKRSRPPNSGRSYSVHDLLTRQPKSLAAHPLYSTMLAHVNADSQLRNLRMTSRCYTLLNQARIAPENLGHFYRTYRLPQNPFFPLFFSIKRDYLADRERKKEDRRQFILTTMRALPEEVFSQIKYLGYLERHYNAAGKSPLWQKNVFPSSMKKARLYAGFTLPEWHRFYRDTLALLTQRYRGLSRAQADRVLACFVLGITPANIPPVRPSPTEIARVYRCQSMRHHPDRGGDAALFISMKKARDALVRV